MHAYQPLVKKAKTGFGTLDVPVSFVDAALAWLETWLQDETFSAYVPQIAHLIETEQWNFLLDAFYQVIPFGTGGRRGLVGIGPNRINAWTIQASAQGHSQYLIQAHGEKARRRGVVLAYDVRCFTDTRLYAENLPNPVKDLDGRALSHAAAQVYAANGIRVYLFTGPRSTPALSFAIRQLGAIAGCVFSASHNLPTDNGKKVYDEHGGQLIPPHDQQLVDEITRHVDRIHTLDLQDATDNGLLVRIDAEVDAAYQTAASGVFLSPSRGVRILYSPLHGTGLTSVYPVLQKMGFDVHLDPATAFFSGAFENVTFNIPNPEVAQSFDTAIPAADAIDADIILNTDPDADRIGIMVRHHSAWQFLNGNEIGILLADYGISQYRRQGRLTPDSVIVKTDVTTSLIAEIAKKNGVQCIGNLLVGFKYIGDVMNQLEAKGHPKDLILGTEESHGFIMGDYARDKDAVCAAIWLAERAADLKKEGRTLVDALDDIYAAYGYCDNFLTEIRLLGARGVGQIQRIMDDLRKSTIRKVGDFEVTEKIDRWQGPPQPHLSATDTSSRNVMVLKLAPPPDAPIPVRHIRLTVRPSGTEPKCKMYVEVLGQPFEKADGKAVKLAVQTLRDQLVRAFMTHCYGILGVDFPERGFLLFWQLPLDDKMAYFDIEEKIAGLAAVEDAGTRRSELEKLLGFLGANPIQKVDPAFSARYGSGIEAYLRLR
ncbi:phospho-sugar mutase [Desulfosarcina sp. OttesenSCG-928-A07]|nr:phospho-sugar mutase [Desulfosarcina sp. OttesenSCG-928-A07]